jgi:hypothetical protein
MKGRRLPLRPLLEKEPFLENHRGKNCEGINGAGNDQHVTCIHPCLGGSGRITAKQKKRPKSSEERTREVVMCKDDDDEKSAKLRGNEVGEGRRDRRERWAHPMSPYE